MSEPIRDQVYKQFLQDKSIIITGEIDNESVEKVALQIIKYNIEDDALEKENMCERCSCPQYKREEEPIKLFISSPGGYVDACLAICGAIESSKTPVHGIVLGEAASAAFVILVSCHKRIAYKHARLMCHELSTGMRGGLRTVQDRVTEASVLQDIMNDIIISKTSITKEMLEENTHRKDWNIDVNQALELKIIDEIMHANREEKQKPISMSINDFKKILELASELDDVVGDAETKDGQPEAVDSPKEEVTNE